MKQIINYGGRLSGRTITMLLNASKDGATIFCASTDREKRILEQAKELGLTIKTMVNGT